MVKNRKAYKELVLRRDICRFIFKARLYSHSIFDAEGLRRHRLDEYLEYFNKYGNLTEELKDLMTRAKVIHANPNYLDEYQDDLVHRIQAVYDEATEDEKEKIEYIKREINTITWLCHDAKSLCSELMVMYLSKDKIVDQEVLKSTIDILLRNYVPYNPVSREYEIAFMPWNEVSWYTTYFFKSDVSMENHVEDLDKLFSKTMEGNASYRQRLLTVMNCFQKHGVPFSEEQMIYMIENDQDLLARALLNSDNKVSSLLNFKDYLDALFEELKTSEKLIMHKPGSPFAKEDISAEDIGNFFGISNLVVFQYLYDGVPFDFLDYLDKKIAELPGSYEIASLISASLRKNEFNTRLASIFEDIYLQANEQLNNSRGNLAFVIKQVAEKKSKQA